jgi:branched-chain amino acid transport system permease protein
MELWGQLLTNGLIMGMTYALVALGVTLIFGILGTINFAHGEFYMLGSFFVYMLQDALKVNYLLGSILTIGIIAILGLGIERFTLRPLIHSDHLNTLLATFALSIILLNSIQMIYGSTPRAVSTPFQDVVEVGGIYLTEQKLFVLVAGIVIIAALSVFIKYSTMGKLMRAVSQNSFGAMVSGISIKKVYSFTFVLGVVLAAVAGILIGPTTYVTPTMGMAAMLKGFVIVILGGLGSVPGAVVGGLLLGIVETAGTALVSNAWKDLIGYVILIVVLLWRPQGIFGFKGRTQ